jgi:hypothetical protein
MKNLILELSGVVNNDLLFNFILDFILIGFAIAIILISLQFVLRLFRFR